MSSWYFSSLSLSGDERATEDERAPKAEGAAGSAAEREDDPVFMVLVGGVGGKDDVRDGEPDGPGDKASRRG